MSQLGTVLPDTIAAAAAEAVYRTVEAFAADLGCEEDITPALYQELPVGVVLARYCHERGVPIPPMLTEPPESP